MATPNQITDILQLLKQQRFSLHNEKVLQTEMETFLRDNAYVFQREHHLSKDSIIDFMIGSIGIEIKITGNPKSIFKQCLRYCEFEEVSAIILVTNKIIKLPATLNKKPAHVLNLGTAWL